MPHIEKKTLQENSGCQYPFNPKTFFKIQDDPSERRSYTHFTNKKQQAKQSTCLYSKYSQESVIT